MYDWFDIATLAIRMPTILARLRKLAALKDYRSKPQTRTMGF
jgi:hypothetical protein